MYDRTKNGILVAWDRRILLSRQAVSNLELGVRFGTLNLANVPSATNPIGRLPSISFTLLEQEL